LFVGDINNHALQKFIAELEEKEGKEIRYTLMSLDDFKYRQQVKDRFINNVIDAKKQVIIDTHDLLTEK
jgi:spore coat polysaccharide biosynthesis protein SpsF (cytidylyltransferase family)